MYHGKMNLVQMMAGCVRQIFYKILMALFEIYNTAWKW